MAAALQEFSLYIDGKDLKSITGGKYYDEIVSEITSPLGKASVSSFKPTEFTDNTISFDGTIDTVLYPTLNDYAERFDEALKGYIKDRKISYEVKKSKKTGKDIIVFTLDYTYKMADLERETLQAKIEKGKEYDLRDEYEEIISDYERAVKYGDLNEQERLLKRLEDLAKRIEELQTIELTPLTSSSEMDLQKKAIESEKGEESTNAQLSPPSVKEPQQAVPPVILPPSEKSTITKSKESSKDRALIESISSMTFDKKILGYEKSLVERASSSSVLGGKETTTRLSAPLSGKETKEPSSPTGGSASIQTLVPSDVSKIMSSVFSGEKLSSSESFLGKDESDTIKIQMARSGQILSSISDTVKMMQETIGSVSTFLKDGTDKISSSFNSIAKDSSSLVSMAAKASESSLKKETQGPLVYEKNTATTNILSEIERKVTEMDSSEPLKNGVASLAENIGKSIKTAVTNIVDGGKKTTIEAPSLPAPTAAVSPSMATSSTTSVVNKADSGDSNVGTQTNQTFFGGQPGMPTVVSLSQSTIDNLASAIIKNMTITPFLNSGR